MAFSMAIPFQDPADGWHYRSTVSAAELLATTPHVLFFTDRNIAVKKIRKLLPINALCLPPMPLHLKGMLWAYTLAVGKKQGGYTFSLISVGPHLSNAGALGRHESSTQAIPEIVRAHLTFFYGKKNEKKMEVECVRKAKGARFDASEQLTLQQLQEFAGKGWKRDNGDVRVRITLAAPRSYFDLSTIIDLNPATVSGEQRRLIEAIVRGEKPPGTDWEITALERAICLEALAMKPVLASFLPLLRLLSLIWTHDGSMPVARRVAVGKMVDVFPKPANPKDAASLKENEHLGSIMMSVKKHRALVSSVRKIGVHLPSDNPADKIAVDVVTPNLEKRPISSH
ncbi:hypothetical protein PRIPAC_93362 [Pristionchus pacificus]|uniref:Uncharacterized protein n=1 Tax=Pristionchus pacificus TaxID=54126 RepID=A0A2A6BQ03_PRIPA|nr:hypothetical protein PRIPAC_93362 [Pristionchus pacificus]|eukprot:PDM68009.1 hypothetical protein PRIPAC_46053 [Pristionchus pacificus]